MSKSPLMSVELCLFGGCSYILPCVQVWVSTHLFICRDSLTWTWFCPCYTWPLPYLWHHGDGPLLPLVSSPGWLTTAQKRPVRWSSARCMGATSQLLNWILPTMRWICYVMLSGDQVKWLKLSRFLRAMICSGLPELNFLKTRW